MRRKIELADGIARKEICRVLGITGPALSMALSFKRNSPSAKKHGRWLWNGVES